MIKKAVLTIALVTVLFSFFSSNTFAETPDPFKLIPENSVFCVRINDLNQSLGNLDMYLAGASPVPLSTAMLVNMQLAAIVGDPMMTGVDKSGAFCFFAVFPDAEANEPVMGLLVPVTDYKQFISTNPNCTKFDENTTILAAPNSPMGAFLLTPTGSNNYALAIPESEKDDLPVLVKAISDSSAQPLSRHLKAAQAKEASAPVWAYINLADLYAKYGDQLTGLLQMAQAGMTSEAPPEVAGMMEIYFKILPELLNTFAGGADAVTLALSPKPDILSIDAAFWAKDGSELAKTLIKNPDTSGFAMTGYLDDKNAVNGLIKLNPASSKQMYDMLFDPLKKVMEDSEFKGSLDKFKVSLDKYCDSMGKEMAMSFSYSAGMPPFQFYEIIDLKNPELMKEYMQESMDFVGNLYKAMGIPMEFKYDPAVSTYKNATLGTLSINFSMPSDPNAEEMAEEFNEAIEKMYGKDGLKYYTAQTPDKFYMAMGSDGETTLKALIDKSAAAASGDFKIAMDTLKGTPYTDAVISVNIIKLLQGMGGMMQSMAETMGEDCTEMEGPAAMFGSLKDIPTQSCLVLGGKVGDGQTGMRLALPKQHLAEVVMMALQIQTQMGEMKQPMEDSNGVAPDPSAAPMELQQDDLQSWLGKEAPELKMTDLEGNIYRISRLKGKTVLLDFWATWCPPCKKAIPDLIELKSNSKDSELVILGLSDESKDKLNEFFTKNKMNYPVVAYGDKLPAPYGQIAALPTLMIIDSKGVIRDILVGYHSPEELQAKLKAVN